MEEKIDESKGIRHPENVGLYAGFSGVELPVDQFDFGEGITIRRTSVRIMAPYLAAVGKGKYGEPWKAVSGGLEFQIRAELHIPLGLDTTNWYNRLNTVWWFAVLVRAIGNPLARVPVLADVSFSEMADSSHEPTFWPIEMSGRGLIVQEPTNSVQLSDLQWIKTHWREAGRMAVGNQDFQVALEAFDRSVADRSASLALLTLWGAIERLFSPSHLELTFRISASIASYLEPRGPERFALYKSVKKLYAARSKAAHGAGDNDHAAFVETYNLLKRALLKMIESRHIPTKSEIEESLFE